MVIDWYLTRSLLKPQQRLNTRVAVPCRMASAAEVVIRYAAIRAQLNPSAHPKNTPATHHYLRTTPPHTAGYGIRAPPSARPVSARSQRFRMRFPSALLVSARHQQNHERFDPLIHPLIYPRSLIPHEIHSHSSHAGLIATENNKPLIRR